MRLRTGAGYRAASLASAVQILRWTEDACSDTLWTGQVCFDFMAGGDGDENLYSIECNPRTR